MRIIRQRSSLPPLQNRGGVRFTTRGKVMNEAECGGGVGGCGGKADCNSNHATAASATVPSGTDRSTASCVSNASSQDIDFVQDNSDYQWFLDYGDGSVHHHHTSVLSSLNEKYGDPDEIGYYDVLSKNLDANLAEADMESFRTEDIHALLTTLPTMCTDMQLVTDTDRQGEMFASVTGSLMAKFDFDSSVSPHSSSQGDDESVASPDTMSICKSELLFSPVKEVPMPGANFSVDSLDCDLEHDLMLTCQANKDNYTIAFEGSVTMYSEESSDDFHDGDKSNTTNSYETQHWAMDYRNKHNQKLLDTSMARSDSGLTTWSKLKKQTSENQLRRHPSGNNNNNNILSGDETITTFNNLKNDNNTLKSQSMPNLHRSKFRLRHDNTTAPNEGLRNSSVESSTTQSRPPHCVKVFNIQNQTTKNNSSCYSDMAISVDEDKNTKPQQHNFNLVKLFMKQKSMSAEGMSCGMDQSSASECWPASQSDDSGDSFDLRHRTRMIRSGCEKTRSAPECSMFVDSLVDPGNQMRNSMHRTHELIHEEVEDLVSERSESVEQLSYDSGLYNERLQYCKKLETNNNGSVEQVDGIIPVPKRKIKRGTQTKRLNETDSCSSIESTRGGKLFSKPTTIVMSTKQKGTQCPVHLMNRSIQTSRIKLVRSGTRNDFVQVIEPSFLAKLKREEAEQEQNPVYVVYPNYTLPDLEFLNEKREDVTKVLLYPQKYSNEQKSKPVPVITKGRRPFSCNDMEMLKRKGFAHVHDWDSLTFLLPVECRQVLTDVPEFMNVIKDREDLLKGKEKPLFCVSPPMRHKTTRPVSCDCGSLMDRNVTNVSSSSSLATQPSSGYRGSSTILTDSSQNSPVPANNFNPLFVYRYDSVTSSEASLMMNTPPVPKRSISLNDSKVPPRPPLPKSILRKSVENCKARKNIANTKRYSMFEMGGEMEEEEHPKRKSFCDLYYETQQRRTLSEHSTETEDEGVEAGHGTDSSLDERFENITIRPPTPPLPKTSALDALSCDELEQLEEYLKMSGISYADGDEWNENELLKLRTHVSKFLSLKINKDAFDSNLIGKKSVSFAEKIDKQYSTPPNSPNVSALLHRYQSKTLVDMPICEEGELSPDGYRSPQLEKSSPVDLSQKISLISAVTQSVEQIIHHFAPANDQTELEALGDAELNPNCAKLILTSLCPALYDLLSDGLKPCLDTTFGPISNSVWQVVEASAQQGPLTKALNDLVMKINEEDVITEGLLKFNAFVFGLLNVRSLDAWASYLRTRETILKKHYNPDSLMVLSQTGGTSVRSLLTTLITALQPLALLPFQIDLLFEYRQLHESLKRMDSYHQPSSPTHLKISPLSHLTNKQLTLMKLVRSVQSNMSQSCDETEDISVATMIRKHSPEHSDETTSDPSLPDLLNSSAHTKTQIREEKQRPRSCVDPNLTHASGFKLMDGAAGTVKKRWSGIHIGSKFVQAFDRLTDDTEEEYTDSLEHNIRQRVGDGSSSPVPSLHDDGPESLDSQFSSDDKPLNGGRFRRLQLKWEMLSAKDTSPQNSPVTSPAHTPNSKSKIPRLVNSPVRSGIPVLSPSFMKTGKKSPTSQPIVSNKKQSIPVKATPTKRTNIATRTSRVDQVENPVHPVRPSSLPYRPVSSGLGAKSKLVPPRRAASSSINRKSQQEQHQSKTPKVVRTLKHRLPSDNGHLSFNEGDKLKVILEVDTKWLLCCRGDQKGLVPRSAVIALSDTGGRI